MYFLSPTKSTKTIQIALQIDQHQRIVQTSWKLFKLQRAKKESKFAAVRHLKFKKCTTKRANFRAQMAAHNVRQKVQLE